MTARLWASLITTVVIVVGLLGYNLASGNTPTLGIDLQGGDPDAPPWLDLILDQPEEFKWRSAALAAKDLSARIPDDTDDPEWRRAVIVLNGLIKISLESPLVDKP